MFANLYLTCRKSKKSLALALISFLVCAAIMLLCSAQPRAQTAPSNVMQRPQIHAQTVRALQAINQGRWKIGRDIIAETKDPLASKLYYWLVFTDKSEPSRFSRLTQFIRNNPEWPGMRGMKSEAEKAMASDAVSPDEVIAWFDDYRPTTQRGMDLYLGALFGQGKTAQAKSVLSDWWAKTPLAREDQKSLYLKYSSFIGRAAHHRRFDMLLFAGQYENARAIARVLGDGYLALADARIALAAEKQTASALVAKVPRALQSDPGLLYERLRWRRRHDMDAGAIEILNNMPPTNKIDNKNDWWRERHILIRRMIEDKRYEAAYALASAHVQKSGLSYAQAEWLSGWLSLRFLKKAPQAFQHFEALYNNVSTPVSKARAAYWAGRAAAALGDSKISTAWYERAAQSQTVYYGQLAGGEIGKAQALPNAAPPVLTQGDIAKFEANELMQAAALFHDAGMRRDASQFIQAFTAHENTPKAYRYAADRAAKMKHYHDALRIAKNATKEGMFLTAQSYPVLTDEMRNVSIEWALARSMMRQESLFDTSARSPAGASGLMQLMPGTAKDVSKKLGIAYRQDWLTTRPDYNIRLGSQYLSDMLVRYDGSYPLAIAAYNAGPGRVDKWIKTYGDPRIGKVNFIDWIEMIPIYETRNYVQRVMENVFVYRLRLKGVQNPPRSAIHVAWKN